MPEVDPDHLQMKDGSDRLAPSEITIAEESPKRADPPTSLETKKTGGRWLEFAGFVVLIVVVLIVVGCYLFAVGNSRVDEWNYASLFFSTIALFLAIGWGLQWPTVRGLADRHCKGITRLKGVVVVLSLAWGILGIYLLNSKYHTTNWRHLLPEISTLLAAWVPFAAIAIAAAASSPSRVEDHDVTPTPKPPEG